MKTITGIHGVPRSGTSWLAQLFNSSPKVSLKFQPLFSYAFKNALNENSNSQEILEFFEAIHVSDDYFINMKDEELLPDYPKFDKVASPSHLVFKHIGHHFLLPHLLKKNDLLKLVLIVRNPLAVLCSWKDAPKEFHPTWKFEDEWREALKKNKDKADYFGYVKWKEATDLFLSLQAAYPNRVRIISYKDLLNDTEKVIEDLFNFSGIPVKQGTFDFIKESKGIQINHPNSVFKLKVNDEAYRTRIPEKIQHEIYADLRHSKFEQFLDV